MNPETYNFEYQETINETIDQALLAHPRLMVARVDLRFPQMDTEAEHDSKVITRFFSSLKAKIAADLIRKSEAWRRKLSCDLKYVWVREFGDVCGRKHYHVLLFVNKDVYHSFGDYMKTQGNLSAMISQAWSSAIRLNHEDFSGLVHFGLVHYLDLNDVDLQFEIDKLCNYASYLSKRVTKRYGDGERSIGCSMKR